MCQDYSKFFQFAERWKVYDRKNMGERRRIENKGEEISIISTWRKLTVWRFDHVLSLACNRQNRCI